MVQDALKPLSAGSLGGRTTYGKHHCIFSVGFLTKPLTNHLVLGIRISDWRDLWHRLSIPLLGVWFVLAFQNGFIIPWSFGGSIFPCLETFHLQFLLCALPWGWAGEQAMWQLMEPQRLLLGPVPQGHLQSTQTLLSLRQHLHLPLPRVGVEPPQLGHCHGRAHISASLNGDKKLS